MISAINFLDAAETAAATVVNSTFVGGDFVHDYANAANWSPAEVPNNSATKVYNVTIPAPFQYVNVQTDATVQNLTVAGQGFDLLSSSYTVNGTAAVAPSAPFKSSGALLIKGSLSNFDAATKTLSGGRYSVFAVNGSAGSLSFPRADIVNNAASISLLGASATITDPLGRDALRNFAHNLPGASFAIAARDYPIVNAFTNDGLLTVGIYVTQSLPPVAASLTINRLTNYDSASGRLAGGSYDIIATAGPSSGFPGVPAELIVAGADIRRNAASITLEVSGAGQSVYDPSFTDENGSNALRNLAENEAGGVFQ
ncbi:MAG: hypothetical protein M3032_12195, partial [Verrucomicrobiota bacterium]|nr:hypothetical protein [Verrucomicrobiota bacterium]